MQVKALRPVARQARKHEKSPRLIPLGRGRVQTSLASLTVGSCLDRGFSHFPHFAREISWGPDLRRYPFLAYFASLAYTHHLSPLAGSQ